MNGDYKDNIFVDIGEDTEEEIRASFNTAIKTAENNGMSILGSQSWQRIINIYLDVFHIRLGNYPPAKVQSMRVEIIPGSTPYVFKARRYSINQRAFLERYTSRLEEFGYFRANPNCSWDSAPLLVPKDPPEHFRITFYMHTVNYRTVPTVWPMPHLEF